MLIVTGCPAGRQIRPPTSPTRRPRCGHTGARGARRRPYWFQYGTSTSYGSSTPHRDGGSGTDQRGVAERVTGLTPDTLYHYRACASNPTGRLRQRRDVPHGLLGLLPGSRRPRVQRALPANGGALLAGRASLRRREERHDQGLRRPGRHHRTVFADLRTKVHDFWDRGLLGLASTRTSRQAVRLRPYTYDAADRRHAPAGAAGRRDLPSPPGPTTDGCVVSGRLSRLEAEGSTAGPEQVLIEDWCQQFPSHSIGDIEFGADGALYVTGGEGASFNFADYGQAGPPRNPCGDPPGGVSGKQTPPRPKAGRCAAQDVRTSANPTGLDGTVIRVDPDTGTGLPDNPLAARTDPDAQRIIAYGLRNPFRLTFRPGTSEPWIGDVGWDTSEEIDRIPTPPAVSRTSAGPASRATAARAATTDST